MDGRQPGGMAWLMKNSEVQDGDVTARYSAIAATVMIALGQLAFAGIELELFGPHALLGVRLAHAAAALLALLGLLARPGVSWQISTLTIYALTLPVLPIAWWAEQRMFASDLSWAPFIGHKMLIVGIALLIPGPPLPAMLLIGAFVGLATMQYYLLDLGAELGLAAAGEPWVTAVYGGLGCGLIAFRSHFRHVARTLAETRAEAEVLAELARFLLVLRDMANTPLQKLEIDLNLLQWKHPETQEAVERMKRAAAELRELRSVFSKYDHLVRWGHGQESLDPDEAKRWLDRVEAELPEQLNRM